MKILTLAQKTLKEFLRNRRTLLMSLILPVAFMLIFGFAFGGNRNDTTYKALVHNEDNGAAAYVKALKDLAYPDGRHMFEVSNVATLALGTEAVKKGDVTLFLDIPNGFNAGKVTVHLYGDPGSATFQAAAATADAVLARFNGDQRITSVHESVAVAQLSQFDFVVPGLMVFSVINMAPQMASTLSREVANHTLTRLRLTKVRPVELLLGVSLGQLAVGLVAVALMFATAALMGFHFRQLGTLSLALLICAVATLAVLGVGMVIAAFAKAPEHAAGLGVLVSVPGSFLSGAFFPIPAVNLFKLAGHTIQIYDILPTTHAIRALRKVLVFGEGIQSIGFEMAALATLTVLYFFVGVLLYRRAHLRPQ